MAFVWKEFYDLFIFTIWNFNPIIQSIHNRNKLLDTFQDHTLINHSPIIKCFIELMITNELRFVPQLLTHFIFFIFQKDGSIAKFRVENSWGDDRGDKGYLVLTSDWFHEFVFEAVIDKKLVPADVLAVYEQQPVVLPAWDPMGTLAQ